MFADAVSDTTMLHQRSLVDNQKKLYSRLNLFASLFSFMLSTLIIFLQFKRFLIFYSQIIKRLTFYTMSAAIRLVDFFRRVCGDKIIRAILGY